MSQEIIRICQESHSRQAQLNPAGTTIGRSHECDIVIDSRHVSRHHARIFSSSEGQWFVEDLGSSNGTFVNGEHVKSCPISRADVIEIGMATLSFSPLVEQATIPSVEAPNIIIEDFGTEVFYDKPRLEDCKQHPCPERLEQVSRCLLEPARAETLYPDVCRLLTQDPKTAAAIFRVPGAALPAPAAPAVMACFFGSSPDDARAEFGSSYPSHLAFRVSHRLLEAVRKDGRPLMTKSIYSSDPQVTVSLIDEFSPQALMCASLGASGQTVDLLYVDVPIEKRSRPSAEEMFAFVQAVAKLISQRIDALKPADPTGGENADEALQ
ncbi:MAG: FHA domain-containing protein [Planctomycetota bacterium]|jgi:hypothetical protein